VVVEDLEGTPGHKGRVCTTIRWIQKEKNIK
jgi:hypothetical protein